MIEERNEKNEFFNNKINQLEETVLQLKERIPLEINQKFELDMFADEKIRQVEQNLQNLKVKQLTAWKSTNDQFNEKINYLQCKMQNKLTE